MTQLNYPRPKITKIEWTDNPTTFEQYFGNLKLLGLDILIDRQRKYGPENIRQGGLYGLKTRIGDKVARLAMALHGRIVNGEAVIDEVTTPDDERPYDGEFDLANYAEIQIALKDGSWGKYPLSSTANGDTPIAEQCTEMHSGKRCIVLGAPETHIVHQYEYEPL